MKRIVYVFFFTMGLCLLSNGADGTDGDRAKGVFSQIDKKLKLLNKPAVKTIKSGDGDIIDCVDINKQPAFDHPALRNHTIQMRPSFDAATVSSEAKQETRLALQMWRKSGSCPNGTIPIRRITREDLLRANSIDLFGRRNPPNPNSGNRTDVYPDRFVYFNNTKEQVKVGPPIENRSFAVLLTYGYNYIGASGEINIWNPQVETKSEFTTSQIWLKGGPGDSFESVESGWTVHPTLFGDSQTRLFAYWTVDAYKKTGCFDLTCSGFVQTSQELALGAALGPISSYWEQYFAIISINLDPKSGNWWLTCNNINVGYWPSSLFSYLKTSAIYVEWGGEVYSPNVRKTPHTSTGMGSGHPAEDLFGRAAYINHARIVDYSKSPKYPQWVSTWTDEYGCYSAFNYKEGQANDIEPVFFFGGEGRSWHCP